MNYIDKLTKDEVAEFIGLDYNEKTLIINYICNEDAFVDSCIYLDGYNGYESKSLESYRSLYMNNNLPIIITKETYEYIKFKSRQSKLSKLLHK